MNAVNNFLSDGVKVRIIIDAQSAGVLALALFAAMVMALCLYSRFK